MHLSELLVLIRGGGDLGSGVAHRLHRAGFTVMITELAYPLVVRRGAAFAQAVYAGTTVVEGVTARLAADPMEGMACTVMDEIPVVVDDGQVLRRMRPPVVVDARLAKRPLDTRREDAPLVIGLGPGFNAGVDCHAVVETRRGHDLGRVIWQGSAAPDTGLPEPVGGLGAERVLRAPRAGTFNSYTSIGDSVHAGDLIAQVAGESLLAPFDGMVRGLLQDGLQVAAGMKVGDIDPRGERAYCFSISDKARAVGGGVLEAVLAGRALWAPEPPPEIRDRGLP